MLRILRAGFAGAALLALTMAAPAVAQTEIQKPKSNWQTPGEIQQPKGPWQKPGEIQIPKGMSAISVRKEPCKHHVSICSDTLFAFDKSTLTPDAEAALKAAAEKVKALSLHPISIEG